MPLPVELPVLVLQQEPVRPPALQPRLRVLELELLPLQELQRRELLVLALPQLVRVLRLLAGQLWPPRLLALPPEQVLAPRPWPVQLVPELAPPLVLGPIQPELVLQPVSIPLEPVLVQERPER